MDGHADVVVTGSVAPGFEGVRDAFAANFSERGELGAGVAVFHRGRLVVDLLGGFRDKHRTVPYDADTLQLVFSSTKGVASICVALCVRRGLLSPDTPVEEIWPELRGARGRTVGELLSHQCGLVTIEPPLTLEETLDWGTAVAALERQEPVWGYDGSHGYHAITFGWLAGELVRRVDPQHRSLGAFLAEELAGPLGADVWIGLPAEHEHRVARLVGAPVPNDPELLAELMRRSGPGTLGNRALTMSGAFPMSGGKSPWNRPDVHAAQIPGANGIATARGLATLYAACIGSVGDHPAVLDAATVAAVSAPRVTGMDRCLLMGTAFGLGFMTPSELAPLAGPRSFGHPGAGGSLAWAHPGRGLAFGYVMNSMGIGVAGDPRAEALTAAVLAAADALEP
jgi:CubicO group peptidase (beta-lactamase class C family)